MKRTLSNLLIFALLVCVPTNALALLNSLTDEQARRMEGTMWKVEYNLGGSTDSTTYFTVGHDDGYWRYSS